MITILALTACTLSTVQGDPTVAVEFRVSVPAGTPKDSAIYLSGNLPALGHWRADGVKLKRHENGRFHTTVSLPEGSAAEYKVTRGSWATVEKNTEGAEIANRTLSVSVPTTVEIEVARWATPSAASGARTPTRTGNIKFHHDFASRNLNNKRTLIVYLPPGYEDAARRFPVLYMHDGQNIFDASTCFAGAEWQADEHAQRLITAGRITPIIIVGIYNNADRSDEYTPNRDDRFGAGGKGPLYAKFVVDEVKPFIDRTYRTKPGREHTAIAGSSLGGLISLYICAQHPDTFSKCGIVSPALMWNDGRLVRDIEERASWIKRVRFWLDMGTAEGSDLDSFNDGIARTRQLAAVFKDNGLTAERDYRYVEIPGGHHNEKDWAARFDQLLLFFFAPD